MHLLMPPVRLEMSPDHNSVHEITEDESLRSNVSNGVGCSPSADTDVSQHWTRDAQRLSASVGHFDAEISS